MFILGSWIQLHSGNFIPDTPHPRLPNSSRCHAKVQGSRQDGQRAHEGANLPGLSLQRQPELTGRRAEAVNVWFFLKFKDVVPDFEIVPLTLRSDSTNRNIFPGEQSIEMKTSLALVLNRESKVKVEASRASALFYHSKKIFFPSIHSRMSRTCANRDNLREKQGHRGSWTFQSTGKFHFSNKIVSDCVRSLRQWCRRIDVHRRNRHRNHPSKRFFL